MLSEEEDNCILALLLALVYRATKKPQKNKGRLLSSNMRANSEVLIKVLLQMGLVNLPPPGHTVTYDTALHKCVCLNVTFLVFSESILSKKEGAPGD